MKEDKLKELLNTCLNDAFGGKHRIKGIASSNDIAGFINDWVEREKCFLRTVGCELCDQHEFIDINPDWQQCTKCPVKKRLHWD
jgi:hypothetical protein